MDSIVWPANAKSDLKKILTYWKTRNESDRYPQKLRDAILQKINQLSIFAKMGTITNFKNVRTLIAEKHFSVFYKLLGSSVFNLRYLGCEAASGWCSGWCKKSF